MFALFAADLVAFTVLATAAAMSARHLEGADLSMTRMHIAIPILMGVLFGLFHAKRYAWCAAPLEQIGSLIRYTIVVLATYLVTTALLFHAPGSPWVIVTWATLPLVATAIRQATVVALGHSGVWSSRALLIGSVPATAVANPCFAQPSAPGI